MMRTLTAVKNNSKGSDKMRIINVAELTENLREMCIEANLHLAGDMRQALDRAYESETGAVGKNILGQLKANLQIADSEQIPICQDTGMAVVFVKAGQEVYFEGGSIAEAINEGVRQGYADGYLRKSVVADPLFRVNTKDNTPAIVHYEPVPGDKVELTIAPKGFGSENMSRIFMLKPADGEEGIKKAVITAVTDAGANACPPMVVGVGVGGDFEKAAIMAKHALAGPLNGVSVYEGAGDEAINSWNRIHDELFESLNSLGIGPGGLGGSNTVLGLNIETFPTHIAGMPLAVNICCHVNRHVTRVI